MVSGTLYGVAESFRTQRVLIAAKYGDSNVKLEGIPTDLSKKSPFSKVPVFQTSDGKTLWDTNAIALFVGKEAVCSSKPELCCAQICQWINFAESDMLPAVNSWVLPSLSVMALDKRAFEQAKIESNSLLQTLDNYLLTRTYLVGERISLADITMACNLLLAFKHVIEPGLRTQFMNVTRWFETCVNQPNFKSVLGEVKLCDTAEVFDGKKFKELQGSAGDAAPASGKKEKKEKQPDENKPKKQEKKKEAEPEEEMDAAELALAQEPKKADPFDVYGKKGNFDMDAFKRCYSNEDTEATAIPYFWDHFDSENWSIWQCDYKYNDELSQVFMSCNLISGMFQRLDKMRKNSFGSVCLYGTNNDSLIAGLWFWRGPELAFELSPDWQTDYSSYEWKKLDPKTEETKKLVHQFFTHEGDYNGKAFNQGKIFK